MSLARGVLLSVLIVIDVSTLTKAEFEFMNLTQCSVLPKAGESCFDVKILNDIPGIEERDKFLPKNAIFFIHISCHSMLDRQRMCSVESMARANPKREVIVLFLAPVSTSCLASSSGFEILKYKNVNIYRMTLKKFLKRTPLDSYLEEGYTIPEHRLSDILRFITLYKYGGMYIDFGVLGVKSFKTLPQWRDWVGKLDTKSVDAGILSIAMTRVGRKIAGRVLRMFDHYAKIADWQHSASELLTRVLKDICTTQEVREMSAKTCDGFAVYSPFYFNPVNYDTWEKYFSFTIGQVPPDPIAFYLSKYLQYYSPEHEFDEFLYNRINTELCPVSTEALLNKDDNLYLPDMPTFKDQISNNKKEFQFKNKLHRLLSLVRELSGEG